MNKLKLFAVLAISGFLSVPLNAQLLQKFTFSGAAGSELTLPPDGQPQNGNLSSIRRGSGLQPNNGNSAFNSKDFTAEVTPDTADYVAFSIGASQGFNLKLDSIVFGQKRSASGPKRYILKTSLDGFIGNLFEDSTTVANSWNNKVIAGNAFANIAGGQNIELRFYGFQSPSNAGTWRLDSIRIYGDISQGGGEVSKPKLSFSPTSFSFSESNGPQNAGLLFSAQPSVAVSGAIFVKGGTAAANSDYQDFDSIPFSFTPGSGLAFSSSVNFLDDAVTDGNKTLELMIRKIGASSDTAFEIGADSMFIFTILDNDAPVVVTGPPTRTIAEIRGANTGNQADSVGKSFRIYGTVYGLNQRLTANGGGYQMFFRDATGGIGIFKNDTVSGITSLNEGDSLRIMGKIECFRGLSQVNLDSMVVLATGRPLKAADLVSSIGESSESNLVKMDGLTINPATWTTGLGGGGFTAKAFNGTDTISIRIDNDCELYSQPAPTGTVSITGMVGQFVPGNPTPVAPFPASGYQLIPRRASDVSASNPGGKPKIRFSPISATITESASNQTVTVLISQAPSVAVEASIYVKGGTASAGTDYTNDTISVNMGPGLPLTLDLPLAFLDDLVQEPAETLTLVIRKKGLVSDTAFDLSPDSIFTFTINDNDAPAPPPLQTLSIAQIRGANTGNQADSVGKSCRIYGTIYGLNQRLSTPAGGYQMFIRDGSGGIGIFKNTPIAGISVLNEGDSVKVMGKIECFRGLSQINPDSMVVLATGVSLKSPDLVTSLSENDEANLVRIDNLVINPVTWTTGVGGGGFTAKAFNGTDTIAIRIDNDCELFSQPAPNGTVNVTGMVGQFVGGNPAPVAPFPSTGYQLIPRRASDIVVTTGLNPSCHCNSSFAVVPNPGTDFISISGSGKTGLLQISDLRGRLLIELKDVEAKSRIDVSFLADGMYLLKFPESGQLVRWVKTSGR